jgi:hypothetical protein
MILTKEEYQSYIGNEMPPARYYDIALAQLKEACYEFTTINLNDEQLDTVKKAVMLQISYFYDNENIIHGISEEISIGKFSRATKVIASGCLAKCNSAALSMIHNTFDSKGSLE